MITRREFLKICAKTGVALSMSQLLHPCLVEAAQSGKLKPIPTVWMELGSCTGNTISFDNTLDPSLRQVFTQMIELRYHWILSVPQGAQAVDSLYDTVNKDKDNYLLVVEGAPQTKEGGRFCYNHLKDGKMIIGLDALKNIGAKAKWVIAIGSCAAFGGPAAAHPNPTGATGVQNVLKRPVINVPGCPAHPDWFVGTLAHLLLYGVPELDAFNRPKMFYGKTIHDQCQRRQDFENGNFAKYPGETGCLFKVGCKGPVTHADCPNRQWSNHINWPVKSGTPCIGCTAPEFPDGMMPFMSHLPDISVLGVKATANTVGLLVGGAAAVGIGVHLVGSILSGRFHQHLVHGTQPLEKTKQQEKQAKKNQVKKNEQSNNKQEQKTEQGHNKQQQNSNIPSRVPVFEITEELTPKTKARVCPRKKKKLRRGFWGTIRGIIGRK